MYYNKYILYIKLKILSNRKTSFLISSKVTGGVFLARPSGLQTALSCLVVLYFCAQQSVVSGQWSVVTHWSERDGWDLWRVGAPAEPHLAMADQQPPCVLVLLPQRAGAAAVPRPPGQHGHHCSPMCQQWEAEWSTLIGPDCPDTLFSLVQLWYRAKVYVITTHLKACKFYAFPCVVMAW